MSKRKIHCLFCGSLTNPDELISFGKTIHGRTMWGHSSWEQCSEATNKPDHYDNYNSGYAYRVSSGFTPVLTKRKGGGDP